MTELALVENDDERDAIQTVDKQISEINAECKTEEEYLKKIQKLQAEQDKSNFMKASRVGVRSLMADATPMLMSDSDAKKNHAMIEAFGDGLPVGDYSFRVGIGTLAVNSVEVLSESNFVLDAIAAMEPRDAFETMLASQAAATHHAAMVALGRASRTKTTQQLTVYETAANKLMRTFAAQMEALRKHRNKATQTIKHVHVSDGGQAIVADTVNNNRKGG